ncbi:hypothetical protein [Demequina sp. NBRC 110055]|uniref:hypothetical protein n=1 Tax=Demequina sp. NBRC 110055 TaxID=1570344 RepID=UPI000A0392CA|nr:hypothetical protein [Demequina sp. NBRC 110055]
MTVPVSTLVHVSALAAAVPQITVSLDTDGGSTVVVGDVPHASMCPHSFRHVVATWPADGGHEPCVDAIRFDGADSRGAVLAQGQSRWFVSELAAQPTVAALRAIKPRSRGAVVQVRFDAVLAVSVVRLESDTLAAEALDDLATEAYAACATEHLLWAATAA